MNVILIIDKNEEIACHVKVRSGGQNLSKLLAGYFEFAEDAFEYASAVMQGAEVVGGGGCTIICATEHIYEEFREDEGLPLYKPEYTELKFDDVWMELTT